MPEPRTPQDEAQMDAAHRRGETTLDTSELAANAAASALESATEAGGPATGSPAAGSFESEPHPAAATRGGPQEAEATEQQPVQGPGAGQQQEPEQQQTEPQQQQADQPREPQAEPTEQEQQEAQEVAERGGFLTDEDYDDLQELGVDLPAKPSEVPDEFRPAYEQLVQQTIDAYTHASQIRTEAQEAVMQVQDFAERLNENPRDALLTMALEKPEAFSDAIDEYRKMEQDEDYREVRRRELETKARERALNRQEQLTLQEQRERKARQVRNQTHRKARELGVDPELAEQHVAMRVRQNRERTGTPDISTQEINEVLGQLAEKAGRPQRQRRSPKPETKSPETQQAEEQAPQTQAEGRGQPAQPSEDSGQEQAPASNSEGGLIRNAVRSAAQRH